MGEAFFDRPILNSPYEYPVRHWELDADGQPTQHIAESRRRAQFITPIPKPRKRKDAGVPHAVQGDLVFDEGLGLSSEKQMYDPTAVINEIRRHVDAWRALPNPGDWKVTPETARLLRHWRTHRFTGIRPFFCQIEAAETLIWLTEAAPRLGKTENGFLEHLKNANAEANPELLRICLKMATGAGKTTVMAMIIAWQTINAVRRPQSRRFTRGFLIVTPGITIKDRLRVLYPGDPDSYYAWRELVPPDMLPDLEKAKIVITNFHAFQLRDRLNLSKGGRSLLRGRGAALNTLETEGQMIQRVMPALMGLKNIMVINDEAHHCYREKPEAGENITEKLRGEEKAEAEENNEAARVWASGLETIKRKLGLSMVADLSATPFFLRGSGYAEGALFPWTVSDFSLMDAIECGIVKLPRVPVADNIPGGDMPKYRRLWEFIGPKMPKKGRGKAALDPLSLPPELLTALDALYGHYQKTFELWREAKIDVPPCFIIVCNNTSTSKLVYDYVSGFYRENARKPENGRLPLFRNFDEDGRPLGRPRTLLIDSRQLESGEALDETFRTLAAAEIERFKHEIIARTGNREAAENLSDQELLREVMNTVGKPGRLGESIRCVVSVAMLTEGWDANTVTHVLGIRAFGTQLLCEQVIGRALRRQSYDLNEQNLFNVEYADVLGIPFDFTARPVVAPPQKPRAVISVHAVSPERDALEIVFPRIAGYRTELPEERLRAVFTEDSTLKLDPGLVGPTVTHNAGIIGQEIDLTIDRLENVRPATLLYHLTKRLVETKFRDPDEAVKLPLFGQLKNITRDWLEHCLVCTGGAYPAQLMYQELADMACERIVHAVSQSFIGERPVKALFDPYNPTGSSIHVNFTTSKASRWQTDSRKCHVNWVVLDSDWEAEFCRAAEAHPQVIAYVKNQGLGFEVPYRRGSENHVYLPDFIVLIDDSTDGSARADPLRLIVEIKGIQTEITKDKRSTMETYWLPGVNRHAAYGRWAFLELQDPFTMEQEFSDWIEARVKR